MHFVPPDKFNITQPQQPPPSYHKAEKKRRKTSLRYKRNNNKTLVTEKRNPYDKWVMFREKFLETDVKREVLIKDI